MTPAFLGARSARVTRRRLFDFELYTFLADMTGETAHAFRLAGIAEHLVHQKLLLEIVRFRLGR